MSFAGMGGPMGGGGRASDASRNAGLPFGGIPEEMREGATKLLATEPEHRTYDEPFSHVPPHDRRFTLATFLAPHKWRLLFGIFLVIFETAAIQSGPFLTKVGIDRGIIAGDKGALITVCWLFAGSVLLSALGNFARISYTGRLGERLMSDLRVRVFSHLQRLSMDFFTGEKAGRLMSRMTSDIEALTNLFQEGIVNLAV